MAILGDILNNLLNLNEDDSSGSGKPCNNCSSACEYFPDSCEICKPYKEKLIDQLYDVEHLAEFNARYEVVTQNIIEGTQPCPNCSASNPASAYACAYCGSQLRESNGKIQVSSAKEIPDPIQLAQNTIFERHAAVCQKEESISGILEGISQLLGGKDGDDFGERMTNDEIEQIAESYGVSVSTYLQGLDNGKYLTASAKALQQSQNIGTVASVAAVGGTALGIGSSYIVGHTADHSPAPEHGTHPPRTNENPSHQKMVNHPGHHEQHDKRPSGGHSPSHVSGKPQHGTGGHGEHHSH